MSPFLLLAILAKPESYLMRLNLKPGQVMKYRLHMETPKSKADLISTFQISKVEDGVFSMDSRLTGLTIDGKSATKALNEVCGGQVATLPWNTLSRRTGTMVPFNVKPGHPELMPYLSEAGIYLACFPRQAVKPGDTWIGSTTATGGCTSGTFKLASVKSKEGKRLAVLEVTNIAFLNDAEQVGPMTMVVDLATGLPLRVEYKAKDSNTGRVSRFLQVPA